MDARGIDTSHAEVKIEFWRARFARFLSRYIRESPRPDCEPSMRFRATMPDGTMVYRATRVEAEQAVIDAVMTKPER